MVGPAGGVGLRGRVHPGGVQAAVQAQGDGDVVVRPLRLLPDGEEGDGGENPGVGVGDLGLLDLDGHVVDLRQDPGLEGLIEGQGGGVLAEEKEGVRRHNIFKV